MRAGFVITTHEESEVGRMTSSAVVFVEVTYGTKLLRYGHGVEVVGVTDCLRLSTCVEPISEGEADLEVTSNDEEINAIPTIDFTGLLDGGVDGVEGSMTLCYHQYGTTGSPGYMELTLRSLQLRSSCSLIVSNSVDATHGLRIIA